MGQMSIHLSALRRVLQAAEKEDIDWPAEFALQLRQTDEDHIEQLGIIFSTLSEEVKNFQRSH